MVGTLNRIGERLPDGSPTHDPQGLVRGSSFDPIRKVRHPESEAAKGVARPAFVTRVAVARR